MGSTVTVFQRTGYEPIQSVSSDAQTGTSIANIALLLLGFVACISIHKHMFTCICPAKVAGVPRPHCTINRR